MAVGWSAMLLALVIGTAIGVAAGYFKRVDFWLMRFTDLVLSLPILPLLLVAVTLFRQPLRANFGPEGGMFVLIVGVIGLTSWMQTARIVRGDILALKEREFILAAGSGDRDHHRIGPVLPRRRLSFGLSDLGQAAIGCGRPDAGIPRAGAAAGHRDFADGAGGELPR